MDLNQFFKWQQEQPKRRTVDIKIQPERFGPICSVWVYDYDLCEGQRVASVVDIDLDGELRRKELEKLAELKAKYEGE